MTLPGLVAANNLSDVVDRERAWDNLGLNIEYPGQDRFYNQVSLLLHGNGTNGSTTITDNSPSPKTVTAVGNAQISTAQSKFGGASIAFDGTGDWVQTPRSLDFAFGTADYTIEFWFYLLSGDPNLRLIEFEGNVDNVSCNLNTSNSGILSYFNGSSNSLSSANLYTTNTWNHLALVRNAGTAKVYLGGTSVITQATTPNTTSPRILYIGGASSTTLNGYIDDLRITKGIARYTANFTPPTAPFPDSP
jgi:hypothetical protein